MKAGRRVMRATATRARNASVEARLVEDAYVLEDLVLDAIFALVFDDDDDADENGVCAEALMTPQSPMMTSPAVSPPREPTLSIALTTE